MPNLPSRYESQVAPQVNRRIIEQPTFAPDTSMGDAAKSVAGVGLEIAGRVQKSITDREIVTAEREARTRLDKLKFDLEADAETPDAAIPVRWKQESDAILQEVAGRISSGAARDVWSENAKVWQGDGEVWSYGLQRKRSVDKVRASHITSAAELETQAGDLTISAETYSKNLAGAKAAIQRDLERGMLDPESAARQDAVLDQLQARDMTSRWSAGVLATARSGAFDDATKMVSTAPGIPEAVKEDALNGIERERNRQEKERAESQRAMGNAMEVDILDGRVTRQQIDEAAALGTINPNDQPTLIRALREENDRRKREAEDAKLSPSQRAMLEDLSKDNLLAFEMLSQDNAPNFVGDPEQWSDAYKQAYREMTADDQRAVLKMRSEMSAKGKSANYVTSVLGDVMAEAKRFAPSLMDEKTNRDGYVKLQGILYANAKKLADENVGKPISTDQARKAVLQALSGYDKKKYGAGVNLALNFDAELYRRVTAQQTARLGRQPTNAEALAAYNAVAGD